VGSSHSVLVVILIIDCRTLITVLFWGGLSWHKIHTHIRENRSSFTRFEMGTGIRQMGADTSQAYFSVRNKVG
jgi:hypothetical protein